MLRRYKTYPVKVEVNFSCPAHFLATSSAMLQARGEMLLEKGILRAAILFPVSCATNLGEHFII
jgi:hypothetical protein